MELIILNAHTTATTAAAASMHSGGIERKGIGKKRMKKRRQKITIKIEVERKTIK